MTSYDGVERPRGLHGLVGERWRRDDLRRESRILELRDLYSLEIWKNSSSARILLIFDVQSRLWLASVDRAWMESKVW
jgi:hypothetical protein